MTTTTHKIHEHQENKVKMSMNEMRPLGATVYSPKESVCYVTSSQNVLFLLKYNKMFWDLLLSSHARGNTKRYTHPKTQAYHFSEMLHYKSTGQKYSFI